MAAGGSQVQGIVAATTLSTISHRRGKDEKPTNTASSTASRRGTRQDCSRMTKGANTKLIKAPPIRHSEICGYSDQFPLDVMFHSPHPGRNPGWQFGGTGTASPLVRRGSSTKLYA